MMCNNGGKKCWAGKLAWLLLVIGGLNWGLVGIGHFVNGSWDSWNVLLSVLGGLGWLLAVIYVLVGLSALMAIFGCRCKNCGSGSCENK